MELEVLRRPIQQKHMMRDHTTIAQVTSLKGEESVSIIYTITQNKTTRPNASNYPKSLKEN